MAILRCWIEIDGKVLIDNVTETTLTFKDNTDLKYFQPKDVIANGNVIITTSSGTFDAGKTPDKLFDGSNELYCADNNPGDQVWGSQYVIK